MQIPRKSQGTFSSALEAKGDREKFETRDLRFNEQMYGIWTRMIQHAFVDFVSSSSFGFLSLATCVFW